MQWGYVEIAVVYNLTIFWRFVFSNLFATRCRKLSIFQHTPALNLYVFPAVGMALCIGIFFCYVPWLWVETKYETWMQTADAIDFSRQVFQTRPIPAEYFFIPLTFALGLLT